MRKWITLREIADDKTTISSTRWAFASVVKLDIAVIVVVLLAALVAHFVPGVQDFDSSFFGSVTALLGVVTTLVTTGKALQGFEPKKDKPHEIIEDSEDETNVEEEGK